VEEEQGRRKENAVITLGWTVDLTLMFWPILGKAPMHLQIYIVQLLGNISPREHLIAEIAFRDPLG